MKVFANLFSNYVRLQCKRKLSQLIGTSQFNIYMLQFFFLSIVFTRVNKGNVRKLAPA